MRKKKKKAAAGQSGGGLSAALKTPLPPAIAARINPLMTIGIVLLALTVAAAVFARTRGLVPFSALLAVAVLGYSMWLRYDVYRRGYEEILFKIVDYTYITRLSSRPTGMLLTKVHPKTSADRGLYHIAVSGRETLPPTGWQLTAYIPLGIEPSEYNGRKYFPTVFGYRIEEQDAPEGPEVYGIR